MNTHWLCGFINYDGSFSLLTRKTKDTKIGERVDIQINIV